MNRDATSMTGAVESSQRSRNMSSSSFRQTIIQMEEGRNGTIDNETNATNMVVVTVDCNEEKTDIDSLDLEGCCNSKPSNLNDNFEIARSHGSIDCGRVDRFEEEEKDEEAPAFCSGHGHPSECRGLREYRGPGNETPDLPPGNDVLEQSDCDKNERDREGILLSIKIGLAFFKYCCSRGDPEEDITDASGNANGRKTEARPQVVAPKMSAAPTHSSQYV